jgi:hypothetical protein
MLCHVSYALHSDPLAAVAGDAALHGVGIELIDILPR